MRKIVRINEDALALLAEGISSKVYHFTSIQNAYDICSTDTFLLSSTMVKDAEKTVGDNTFYMSTTRIRNGNFGYSTRFSQYGVRFELDGSKLMEKYKGGQINYWNGMNDKFNIMDHARKRNENGTYDDYAVNKFRKDNPNATEDDLNRFISRNFDRSSQTHVSNESEDRIYSREPSITDAHKYIISVDIIIENLFQDESKVMNAYAFLLTPLREKIRIFDNSNDFNNPKGKDVNEKLEAYLKEHWEYFDAIKSTKYGKQEYYYNMDRILSSVIGFITWPIKWPLKNDFEKNIAVQAASLLKKYGLESYLPHIGTYINNMRRKWSFNSMAEDLYAERRVLDIKNQEMSRVSRMLSDYVLSLGAKSYPQAVKIKKEMIENSYNKVYDRIDTMIELPYIICKDSYTISIDPNHDLFRNLVGLSEDSITAIADNLSSDMEYYGNLHNSKNRNSMFQYLRKLLTKGTVNYVRDILTNKLGLDEDTLKSWNIYTEITQMDYYKATNYSTVNARKYETNDYRKARQITDKEVEEYIKKMSQTS